MMTDEPKSFALNISNDLETNGFDLQAGQTWIYPTNYPIREYQYNIVQEALLKNTLVSLPTGLGKTFIAAVVMYNFFRWYPLGKVIFMAPTRPLVKQQIEACYNIMAIPKEATVELTGTKISAWREDIWKEKRVFFITPQILQNDLEKLIGLHQKIKCLIFDEAHRARGNHAYCEVIRKLVPQNKYFRVLALSATPGSNISDILEVVNNLLISHLEFRTEESTDVRPYVFERNLTTIVVPLGEKLQQVRDDYLQVLEYYTRTLIKYKVIHGNCGNLTKGKIFMTLKEFQQKNRANGSSNYAEIMKSLNICVTLYHGFELLIRHGLRSFLSFFEEHVSKPLLKGNTHLTGIMNDIREYLGPEPINDQLPDGSFAKVSNTSKFGHPKFYKLRDILVSHFAAGNDSSRVIVFFEYRNSVIEAYALLNQSRPLLKPRIFLGQGRGITQRQQISVIKSFKEGHCNILLSTCIGEEGLDVGEVDLIVCFDISNKSPIRMVQRMGRTGRKSEGHVVVLVTEGKEQQILKDCLIHKNNIAFHLLSSKELAKGLKTNSPRLIPSEILPKCDKIYITIKKSILSNKCSLKTMFGNISNSSSKLDFSPDLQILDINDRIPRPENLWDKGNILNINLLNIYSKRMEKQRTFQPIHLVKHSASTELLVKLMQHVDSKRFNIPVTQIGNPLQLTQSRNLKQSDIRKMFLKSQNSNELLLGSQAQELIPMQINSTEDSFLFHSKELLLEVSNYVSIQLSHNKTTMCKHCPNNFKCINHNISHAENITWIEQDESVFNIVTSEDLKMFFESYTVNSKINIGYNFDCNLYTCIQYNEDKILNGLITSQIKKEKKTNNNSNAYLENDIYTDIPSIVMPRMYCAPKSLNLILNKYSTSITDIDVFSKELLEEKGSIKQIYDDYVCCDAIDYNLLNFFKIKSLEELFHYVKNNSTQETIIYSPDIIENSFLKTTNTSESNNQGKHNLSPVLCRFERARNIKNFQRTLFNQSQEDSNDSYISAEKTVQADKPNLNKIKLYKSSGLCKKIETPSKFTLKTVKPSSTPLGNNMRNRNSTGLDDDFNLQKHDESFEKHCEREELKNNNFNYSLVTKINENEMVVDDICDLSIFGLPATANLLKELNRPQTISNNIISTSLPASNLYIDEICDLRMFGIENQKNKIPMNTTTQQDLVISKVISKEHKTASGNIIDNYSSKENMSRNDTLNIDLEKCIRPSSMSGQTQVSITQLIDLINTDEKFSTFQEENLNIKSSRLAHKDSSKTVLSSKIQSGKSFNSTKCNHFCFNKSVEDEVCDKINSKSIIKLNAAENHLIDNFTLVKNKYCNPFIENEAELSFDKNINISTDEDDQSQSYEASFVDDNSENMDTQIHIQYLQSTRSPRNQGKFKIPEKSKLVHNDIYSQEVQKEDDTYLNDSFVVHDGVEDLQHELSILEILEEKLLHTQKRRRNGSSDTAKQVKRRRIKQLSSDDSD